MHNYCQWKQSSVKCNFLTKILDFNVFQKQKTKKRFAKKWDALSRTFKYYLLWDVRVLFHQRNIRVPNAKFRIYVMIKFTNKQKSPRCLTPTIRSHIKFIPGLYFILLGSSCMIGWCGKSIRIIRDYTPTWNIYASTTRRHIEMSGGRSKRRQKSMCIPSSPTF